MRPKQMQLAKLRQTEELFATTQFDMIPKDRIPSLISRWKSLRLEWQLRRYSLLALWRPWREHYAAWVNLCDREIAALRRALDA